MTKGEPGSGQWPGHGEAHWPRGHEGAVDCRHHQRQGEIGERKSNGRANGSVICTEEVVGADIPLDPCLGSAWKADNN